MSTTKKALVGGTGVLLLAFVVFGIITWIRVIQVIPYSSSCATTLIQISRQSAVIRPFFFGAFALGITAFEISRRGLPKALRFGYLIVLGLGAALLFTPWLMSLFYS